MTFPKRDWKEAWIEDDAEYKALLRAEVHIQRALVLKSVVVNKNKVWLLYLLRLTNRHMLPLNLKVLHSLVPLN